MNELYRKIQADVDFWDGRPLLMLQREAELMLLPDVREFAEANPWTPADLSGLEDDSLTSVARLSSLDPSRFSEARRVELLKKMGSGKQSKVASFANKIRRNTLRASRASPPPSSPSSVEDIVMEARWCVVSKYDVRILTAVDQQSDVEFQIPILGLQLTMQPDVVGLEFKSDAYGGRVFFLQFDDTATLAIWQTRLETSQEKLSTLAAGLKAKQDKILSLSCLPPPPKQPSASLVPLVPPPKDSPRKKSGLKDSGLRRSSVMRKTSVPTSPEPEGYRVIGSMAQLPLASGYNVQPLSEAPVDGVSPGRASMYGSGSAAPNSGYSSTPVNFDNTGYGMVVPPEMMMDPTPRDDARKGPPLLNSQHRYNGLSTLSDSGSSSEDDSSEQDLPGVSSRRDDFNEIFQCCVTRLRELEYAPPGPQTSKMRTDTYVELIGLAEDFVTSAVRYGQIIISEVYLPVSKKTIRPATNVGGVIGGEKFVVHNILFKFALDSSGVFGGNDESAAKVAGLELKGLQAYMSSNTPDLCYPLMALIDYKGFRLVASSLLPLTRDSLQYGSQDAAVTVKKSLPALTQRIEQASASLNLKLHEAGKDRVVMATAVDIEGHLGRDNRFYLLDFSRVFPPVTPNRNVDGSHLFQMFRPEFVKSFTLFPLCSDAYSNFTAGLEHAKEHAEEVDLASMELLNVSVSNFVAELIARMGEEARIAGSLENFALTQLLHSHGINVRYLGEVVRKMGRHPFALVVLSQMVARVVKMGVRRTLRSEMKRLRVSIDEPYRIAAKDFLNRVFSASEESEQYWAEEVPQLLNERFQLRPGNWNAFPKNLKRTLFDLEKVNGIAYNAKVAIFREVQAALGLRVAPALVVLLQTQPKVYQQKAVFDDVDVEDVGLRVKFLDVISNAQGYVFSKRAEEKEKEGFFEAAKSLYQRAYMGYQAALSSCPNDSILLRNCALVMTKIYRLEVLSESSTDLKASLESSMSLKDADPDDPLLYAAQQNFKKAIQANRKSPVFYTSYADFLTSLGNYSDAEAHYLEALLRDPWSVQSLRAYAKLLELQQRPELAEKFTLRANEVEKHVKSMHKSSEKLGEIQQENLGK